MAGTSRRTGRTIVVLAEIGCVTIAIASFAARNSSADASSHVPQPTARLVGSIAYGSGRSEIGASRCSEGEEGCILGFAFLGDDELLYLYDYGHDDIKRIKLGRDSIASLSVIRGVRPSQPLAFPRDGTAAIDGTIFLVSDQGRDPDRLRVLSLSPGDSSWKATSKFDLPSDDRPGAPHVPIAGGVRIQVDPGAGAVVRDVYSGAQTTSGVRESGDRLEVRPDSTLAGSAPSPPSGSSFYPPFLKAQCYGSDQFGRWFFGVIDNGPPFHIRCYTRSGRLIAESEFPKVHFTNRLIGRGHEFLARDGRLLILEPTEKNLRIWTWSPD